MRDGRLSLLSTIAEYYLKNPFFILDSSGEKDLLLHQTETVGRCIFLIPTRVLIADVIGLGKTVTALRIMEMLRIYDNVSRILIVIPSVLLPQWLEELRSFGIVPTVITRDKLRELEKYGELPSGVYVISIDRLKREEYLRVIEKGKWDLIIVDEAQKIGFVGGKPTRRFEKIGGLLTKLRESNVVLLSATPHKGFDHDYLARLSLVDPSLATLGSLEAFRRVARRLDASFYGSTHYVILHRRTKGDINEVYSRSPVFKNCYMFAVLVRPRDYEERMLSNLIKVGERELVKYYEELASRGLFDSAKVRGISRLLRKLIVKRGLSSPQSLIKTFSKITLKRKLALEMLDRGLEPEEVRRILEERIPELESRVERLFDPEAELEEGEEDREPDEIFNEIADAVGALLPERFVRLVKEAVEIAQRIVRGEYEDTKLETVKRIIEATSGERSGIFSDLCGAKVIIFTEFRDTADYVYNKLLKWFVERYGERGRDMIRKITSENREDYEEVAKWLRENPYAKVLVTTDVLGEGLNLQVANVLVNYEITWSPIRLEQRIGRVWRYGQRRNCYVFNLFYLHRYERDVAENVFRKLYGIKEAIEKQEVTLGDEVYMSAIGDSLLENVVKERLGREYAEYSRYLGGFIPLTFRYRGRDARLTESELIEKLFEGELGDYIEEFIRALVDLAKRVREKNVYPKPLTREEVERFLEQSFGVRNVEEASYIAVKLGEAYERVSGKKLSVFSRRRPDLILKEIRSRGSTLAKPLVLILPSERRLLYVLAKARIRLRNERLGRERFYEDLVLVKLDIESRRAEILRGRELAEALCSLLPPALEVDEHYGLEEIVVREWSRVKGFVVGRLGRNFEIGTHQYNDMLERISRYEREKWVVGGSNYFGCRVAVESVEPICYLVSVGVFPESRAVAETGVWFGFENRYLRDIVLKYEELNGRVADVSRREKEHYDVYSYSEGEERYIEVKGFVKPRLEIRLTEREYETAKNLGDRYWVYLVYGVGTENPVILCIRNPVERLELTMTETAIVRREYVWSRRVEV